MQEFSRQAQREQAHRGTIEVGMGVPQAFHLYTHAQVSAVTSAMRHAVVYLACCSRRGSGHTGQLGLATLPFGASGRCGCPASCQHRAAHHYAWPGTMAENMHIGRVALRLKIHGNVGAKSIGVVRVPGAQSAVQLYMVDGAGFRRPPCS